ncbi:MAG: nucleotide sugar dehydrogenase, partial [Sandaracinaceae bacterium]|nr:nucleotide sugar dehydrogenase [Sandaracinaceae bacterium]
VKLLKQGKVPIGGDEPGLGELVKKWVNAGRLSFDASLEGLEGADAVFVCVDTPVDPSTNLPLDENLREAVQGIAGVIKDGAIVVIESTIAPGTMSGKVKGWIEEKGHKVGTSVGLAHCPERVMPGALLERLRTMPRVCGVDSPQTGQAIKAIYKCIVRAPIHITSWMIAEVVKVCENAYRDLNIAFANEVAKLCEVMGVDFLEVQALVNQSPGRQLLMAGLGVGGHCIPKDPWLLANAAPMDAPFRLIPVARVVNDEMPLHALHLLEDALKQAGKACEGALIAILGYAYREESDDERDSPSARLEGLLLAKGAVVRVHDPYIQRFHGSIEEVVRGVDGVVIAVAHRVYRSIDWSKVRQLVRTPVLLDTRFVIEPAELRKSGWIVRGIGRPRF